MARSLILLLVLAALSSHQLLAAGTLEGASPAALIDSGNSGDVGTGGSEDSTWARSLQAAPTTLCALAVGDWCSAFNQQPPIPFKPPPRGNKSCPDDCNHAGTCNYDTGLCYCPAGRGGLSCGEPRKRPCYRMGPDKRDIGWTGVRGWMHSRCGGICDDDTSMCYCPPETKYGHVPAPLGSPLGTPPVKQGRPMYMCYPSSDVKGVAVDWAPVWATWKYDEIFNNSTGYCEAERPPKPCHCIRDGLGGPYCDQATEMYCPNQCSARGDCLLGFCVCHEGWYGNDCSRARLGVKVLPDDLESGRKVYLKPVLTPVAAAADPPLSPTRKRPLVYVYDLSPEFGSDLLQFRQYKGACTYREFGHGNHSGLRFNSYTIEPVLHELFLTTHHRTFDPEDADFFYVPHYATCLFEIWSTNALPVWPNKTGFPGTARPFLAANMLQATEEWVSRTFPYFNRSGGADHVWLMAHDEGACYAPQSIWPGLIISPWGRMDPAPHLSQTSYGHDNYSRDLVHGKLLPDGWLSFTSHAHPCYDPVKDLVIPVFKDPEHYSQSPYLGGRRFVRDVLMFFRGDMGAGKQQDIYGCVYSRCIRQRLLNLSKTQEWDKKTVWYGENNDVPGAYSDVLSRSIFCLVLPGDGWSARFPDAMLHGCIPVIIMDNVHGPYENILDYSQFSLRHKEADLSTLLDTLKAVSAERISQLQAGVNRVWHRFRFMGLTAIDNAAARSYRPEEAKAQPGSEFATGNTEDGFETVLQFLHSRLPHVLAARQAVAGSAAAAAPAAVAAVAPAPLPVAEATVESAAGLSAAAAGVLAKRSAAEGLRGTGGTGGTLVAPIEVAEAARDGASSPGHPAGADSADFVFNTLTHDELLSFIFYALALLAVLLAALLFLALRYPRLGAMLHSDVAAPAGGAARGGFWGTTFRSKRI